MIKNCATDPVPNVRFGFVKQVEILAEKNAALKQDPSILSLLTTLKDDTDFDVVYFATELLLKWNK